MAPRLTLSLAAAALAVVAAGCSASRPAEPFGPAPSLAAYTPIARSDLSRLDGAIHRYAADRAGRLPPGIPALGSERDPDGGTYMSKPPTTDPWGEPYVYAVLDARLGTFDLRSYGPDRLPGTEDDVVARADPVPIN